MVQNTLVTHTVLKFCGIVLIVGASLLLLGHASNIYFLESIALGFPAVKVITALLLVIIGINLCLLAPMKSTLLAQRVIKYIGGWATALIVTLLLITMLTDVNVGFESVGMPAWGTLVAFLCISISFILKGTTPKKRRVSVMFLNLFSICLGISALIGYLFNISSLYYYVSSVNTGMSPFTAMLILLASGALLFNEESFT